MVWFFHEVLPKSPVKKRCGIRRIISIDSPFVFINGFTVHIGAWENRIVSCESFQQAEEARWKYDNVVVGLIHIRGVMQGDEQLVKENTELSESEGMVADSSSEAARSLPVLWCEW